MLPPLVTNARVCIRQRGAYSRSKCFVSKKNMKRFINFLVLISNILEKSMKYSISKTLQRDEVTTDDIWIGNRIYWTLAERNYK
jgi:hypothetical protein